MEAGDSIRIPSGCIPSQKLGILSLENISEDYEICLPHQIILIAISKSRVEKRSIHVMIKEKKKPEREGTIISNTNKNTKNKDNKGSKIQYR